MKNNHLRFFGSVGSVDGRQKKSEWCLSVSLSAGMDGKSSVVSLRRFPVRMESMRMCGGKFDQGCRQEARHCQ